MAAYVMIAGVEIKHLLTAVIMTAPATIMLAKIFYPGSGQAGHRRKVDVKIENTAVNIIDAAAQGAGDGLHLALNVAAMLIAFLALIAMVNGILGGIQACRVMGWVPASLQTDLRLRLRAGGLAAGRELEGCADHRQSAGHAPGVERIRGVHRPGQDQGRSSIRRSFVIATYALCGFANFSSIAIQVGGIGALAPTRKSDLARLGLKAVACGTMANFMSACIAGMLL